MSRSDRLWFLCYSLVSDVSRQAALTSLAALEPPTAAELPAHYIIHPSIIDRNKLLGGSSGGSSAVQLLTVLAGKPPRGFREEKKKQKIEPLLWLCRTGLTVGSVQSADFKVWK